jgi:protein subunit release factor A
MILFKVEKFQQQFAVLNSAVHCVIKYNGSDEKASQFKYKFNLGKRSDKISMYNFASSYTVDVQAV